MLSVLHVLNSSYLCEVESNTILILQIKNTHKQVKQVAQGHMDIKWQKWDTNLEDLVSEATLLKYTLIPSLPQPYPQHPHSPFPLPPA